RAVTESLFDFAAAVRQVSTPIAADHLARSRRAVERVLQIRRQDLDRETALREDDHLEVLLEELHRDASCLVQVRAADPEFRVDDRRVHEEEELLAAWRAALLHQLEWASGEPFGQFLRIGDRCRGTDEDRIRSVVTADPLQPSKDVREMAAEDAAIRVQFV